MKTPSECRPGVLLPILFVALCLAPAPPIPAQEPAVELACPSCVDLNACTIDSCDTNFGTCRHTPLGCDDGNPCTTDSCAPGQFSLCQHTALPLGTACDDGNSCTTGETCNGSQVCQGITLASGSSCDDSDPCTQSDTCNGSGTCRGTQLSAGDPCDDESLCTTGETCINIGGSLACVGSQTPCDDSDPCTQDSCEASTGACLHPPVSCDDGNPCTGDSCDPATGSCFRAMLSGPCSDGDVCTDSDSCMAGNCVGSPRNCDDGIACTGDRCDRFIGGCDHIPNSTLCNDNNVCTSDTCDRTFGCRYQNLSGNPCTPENKCLVPICRLGTCGLLDPITCNDGNACTFDRCDPSIGCVFPPLSCDDQNSCTADSCNSQTGCIHQPLSQAPVIAISQVVPQILKPANHKLVQVDVTVSAQADCGPLPAILASVKSSQADDAPGPSDGHTVDDIQGAELGTSDTSFFLRAEFDRSLGSRIYTIVYTVTAADGSSASATATVTVPPSGTSKPQLKVDPREGTDQGPAQKKPGTGK
jgi:slime mold repeat-containing protein